MTIDFNRELFLSHLKQFTAGTCFLCDGEAKAGAVLHLACAEAYGDEKRKRVTQALKDFKSKKPSEAL